MARHNLVLVTVVTVFLLVVGSVSGGRLEVFPLEAREEDSLMSRWEQKEVHASRLIDDMEEKGRWNATGIGEVSYTKDRARDGKRSLRFRTSLRDEEHYRKNRSKWGTFDGSQGGSTWMYLGFDEPQDWSAYNRVSLWVYVHPTSMPTYCFDMKISCEAAPSNATVPRTSHFVQDLKPGEWNHVLWEIPHLKRDKVIGFTVHQMLRGHEPEDEGVVTYDFDRFEVQRVDADMYEGWNVEKGKFAFCHVGYRPGDEKVALAGEGAGDEFELIDAAGKIVFSGKVDTIKNNRGEFRVLDFSDHRKAGEYRLRSGKLESRPFRIGQDVWERPVFKAINFFFCQRCGYTVPGVHRKCHQDWQGFHGELKKVINGGWHDAGDLSQGLWRTAMSTFAMLRIVESLRQGQGNSELEERIVEEAVWGLEWLLKTRFGDGYRAHWGTMRIYTDNEIGTIDDVLSEARNVPWENFLSAAVECEAGRLLAKSHPELAQRCVEAAVEDWQEAVSARKALDESAKPDRDWWGEAEYLELAWGATSSVMLYRRTGDTKYAEQGALFGKLLLKCQEQRFVDGIPITGYFYRDTSRRTIIHFHHTAFEEAPLVALAALCEELPEHEDWINWYAAAAMHSEFFLKRGSAIAGPYELLPNSVWPKKEILSQSDERRRRDMLRQFEEGTRLDDEHVLRTFPIYRDILFHGNTNIQMSTAWALAEASRLRKDEQGMRLVGRQVEWVFGANPFGQSLMYGEGYDFAPQFAYCLKNLVGSLPVGMDSMTGDQPYWSGSNEATFKEIWVEPVNRFLGAMSIYATQPSSVRRGEDAAVRMDAAIAEADRNTKTLKVTVTVTGEGNCEVAIKAFNADCRLAEKVVELSRDEATKVGFELQVEDVDKPWVIVLTADGVAESRRELVGSFVSADGLN